MTNTYRVYEDNGGEYYLDEFGNKYYIPVVEEGTTVTYYEMGSLISSKSEWTGKSLWERFLKWLHELMKEGL